MIQHQTRFRIRRNGRWSGSTPMRKGAAFVLRLGTMLCVVSLAACSSDAERLRTLKGDPSLCREGTFIGSMTGNCPQPLK